MDEIRIAWRIGGYADGGRWHVATERRRAMLAAIVEDCNRRLGPESHWIETRKA